MRLVVKSISFKYPFSDITQSVQLMSDGQKLQVSLSMSLILVIMCQIDRLGTTCSQVNLITSRTGSALNRIPVITYLLRQPTIETNYHLHRMPPISVNDGEMKIRSLNVPPPPVVRPHFLGRMQCNDQAQPLWGRFIQEERHRS